MLRTVFDDEFLQIFSYVGQKKKRIFSSLASCAIIFGNNIFKKIRTYYVRLFIVNFQRWASIIKIINKRKQDQ